MKPSRVPQASLLDDADSVSAQPDDTFSLRLQPSTAEAMSPAAKAFNRALQRVEKLQRQLHELDAICQAHGAALTQAVQPLRSQRTSAMHSLLERLCTHLDQPAKGLSKVQRSTLRDIVCNLARNLMELGVAGMEAVHDRYSPQTLAQMQQEENAAMRQGLEDLMGHFTGESLQLDTDTDDPEAMLQAALEQLRAQAQQEEAERQARAATRQARQAARQAKKGATAQQQQAAQALKDADTSLRQIYRQLASALHPDREPEPTERERKHQLMSQANAAYERKDLVALLQLQLQAELVDPDHLERVSQERLQQLTLLLKQQAAELDKQRQHEQQRWISTFDLPLGMPLTAASLRQHLNAEIHYWELEVNGILADMDMVNDATTLKPWLNEQRRLLRQAEREMAWFGP